MSTHHSGNRLSRPVEILSAAALALALPALVAAAPPPAAARVWLDTEGRPIAFDTDQMIDFLTHAKVISSQRLSTGITKPSKLTLERNGVRAHAVFHSIDRRERKVKALGNGEFAMYLVDRHENQVAAFELSRLLGMAGVPPAVRREVGGREGSVQLWIENAVTEQGRRERALEPPDRARWNQQKADQWVFDNLINNIDRNTGNTLIDAAWNVWLIDHTRSFGRDRQLPYPEKISVLSEELWAGLRALDPERVRARLGPYLAKAEIGALLDRRLLLIEAIEARIARLGEDRVVHDRGNPWASVVRTTISESRSSSR